MKLQKHDELWRLAQRRWGRLKPREPLRTLAELADEFGITASALGKLLADSGAPKPVIDNRRNGSANKAKWYVPTEVRAWLAQVASKPLEDQKRKKVAA
jgi:hypothetical protein